jgi:hypothetical protein
VTIALLSLNVINILIKIRVYKWTNPFVIFTIYGIIPIIVSKQHDSTSIYKKPSAKETIEDYVSDFL